MFFGHSHFLLYKLAVISFANFSTGLYVLLLSCKVLYILDANFFLVACVVNIYPKSISRLLNYFMYLCFIEILSLVKCIEILLSILVYSFALFFGIFLKKVF